MGVWRSRTTVTFTIGAMLVAFLLVGGTGLARATSGQFTNGNVAVCGQTSEVYVGVEYLLQGASYGGSGSCSGSVDHLSIAARTFVWYQSSWVLLDDETFSGSNTGWVLGGGLACSNAVVPGSCDSWSNHYASTWHYGDKNSVSASGFTFEHYFQSAGCWSAYLGGGPYAC